MTVATKLERTTLIVRISGKAQDTEAVDGYDVNGFFVHHVISEIPYAAKRWTVSHSWSGMNLGARFERQHDALQFAREMAATYQGRCEAQELINQFIARGEKPSCEDLAKQCNMLAW